MFKKNQIVIFNCMLQLVLIILLVFPSGHYSRPASCSVTVSCTYIISGIGCSGAEYCAASVVGEWVECDGVVKNCPT
jgi:hypothetical protein